MGVNSRRWLNPQIKNRLDRLDQGAGRILGLIRSTLQQLDRWGEKQWREYKYFWHWNIWHGGSKQLTKPRTGNRFKDFIFARYYDFCRFLDWLDTMTFFRGRIYQAKTCRVRSKAEKTIANYFTDHGVSFQYEKKLRLGSAYSKPFRPDFYLRDYGVYVEYWGLVDCDPDYEKRHQVKLAIYHRHNIPVVSIYPRQLGNLKKIFPKLFRDIIGKEFPKSKKGESVNRPALKI